MFVHFKKPFIYGRFIGRRVKAENSESCFARRHRKHIHIITWSQLNRLMFSQESSVCPKQDQWSEYSMLSSVTTHSIVHQVCGDVDLCVKSGSCSLSSLKWKVEGQYWKDILIYVSCYQTLCRQQYYLPFSNTAHACTSTCLTAAAQNYQLHFSWAIAPNRPELNSINYEI